MHFWCLQLMGLLYFLKNEKVFLIRLEDEFWIYDAVWNNYHLGIVDTLTELWSCVALLLPLNNNVIGLFIMLLATQSDRWIRFMPFAVFSGIPNDTTHAKMNQKTCIFDLVWIQPQSTKTIKTTLTADGSASAAVALQPHK